MYVLVSLYFFLFLLLLLSYFFFFFFSSRRRHTRSKRDWSSDVCSSDLDGVGILPHMAAGPFATTDAFPPVKPTIAEPVAGRGCQDRGVEKRPVQKRSEERRVGKECRSRWAP